MKKCVAILPDGETWMELNEGNRLMVFQVEVEDESELAERVSFGEEDTDRLLFTCDGPAIWVA